MRLLEAVQTLSQDTGGLRTDVCNMKESVINSYNGRARSDSKTPTRINYLEDMLSKILPCFKTTSQKLRFGPVVFNQLFPFKVLSYNPPSFSVRRTKELLEVVIVLTRDGKLAYDTDFGRHMNIFRRAIVKVCITNALGDVFNMF